MCGTRPRDRSSTSSAIGSESLAAESLCAVGVVWPHRALGDLFAMEGRSEEAAAFLARAAQLDAQELAPLRRTWAGQPLRKNLPTVRRVHSGEAAGSRSGSD